MTRCKYDVLCSPQNFARSLRASDLSLNPEKAMKTHIRQKVKLQRSGDRSILSDFSTSIKDCYVAVIPKGRISYSICIDKVFYAERTHIQSCLDISNCPILFKHFNHDPMITHAFHETFARQCRYHGKKNQLLSAESLPLSSISVVVSYLNP